MRVGDEELAPGTRTAVRLPVSRALHGGEISLWCHAVRGRHPGPTLTLLSTLHGSEWFYLEYFRRLLDGLDPAELRGTLLVVPVANPPALSLRTRNSPDDGDSPDPNRIFPGGHSWLTDQLVRVLSEEILARSSCLLDFHRGAWGAAARHALVAADLPTPHVSEVAEHLALEFGTGAVRRADVMDQQPGPRSAVAHAGAAYGVPAVAVEWGGPGFGERHEARWLTEVDHGVRRVMAALGMCPPGPVPDASPRQLVYRQGHRANPSVAGMLLPRCGPDRLGGAVRAGELLGEVVDPQTFEVLEELRAPADGTLFLVGRDYPVVAGEWSFGIAVADDHSRVAGPRDVRDSAEAARRLLEAGRVAR